MQKIPKAIGKKSAVALPEKAQIKGLKKINTKITTTASCLFKYLHIFIIPTANKASPIRFSSLITVSGFEIGMLDKINDVKYGNASVFA